jgi:hypothetical protein
MTEETPRRTIFILNIAAKTLLLVLLAYVVANYDLPRFAGKGMLPRAITYPLATVLVPLVWVIRGKPRPYHHATDALLVSPFIVDVAGNVANLYNTIVWFDDIAHAVTWMLLVAAFGSAILRLRLAPWITGSLCVGFGAVTHILWEIIEFLMMQSGALGMQLTYGDTIGDLALSLTGSAIAGVLVGWWARAQPRGDSEARA